MIKIKNPFKRKVDFDKYIKEALKAVFSNIPSKYEVKNLRVSLDPEFEYSTVEYNLVKKELVKKE